MNLEDILIRIFAYVGGGGFIIKIIIDYFKDKKIEKYKNELLILKENNLRYSSKQFELYSQLWSSLYDLKIAADELWERANVNNLKNFLNRMKETQKEIEKSSLFIEDDHYAKLKKLLTTLSEYKIGKKRLIDIRASERIDSYEINHLIDTNKTLKQEYEKIIYAIRDDLKRQLKGLK